MSRFCILCGYSKATNPNIHLYHVPKEIYIYTRTTQLLTKLTKYIYRDIYGPYPKVYAGPCAHVISALVARGCNNRYSNGNFPCLNKDKLKTELEIIYRRLDFKEISAVHLLKFLIENNFQEDFSKTFLVLQAIVTTPMTNAEAERCFSTLKRIKTYLRSTMAENRLTALAMLSIEKQMIQEIPNCNELVIDEFISKKHRRIDFQFMKYKNYYSCICKDIFFGEAEVPISDSRDENIRKQWTEAVGKHLPENGFVCSTHFARHHIGNLKLLQGAIPTCFPTSPENPMEFFLGPSGSHTFDSPDLVPIPLLVNHQIIKTENDPNTSDNGTVTNIFSLIKNGIIVNLPDYWSVHKLEKHIVFSKVALQENQMPYLERSVVLTTDAIHAQAKNRSVDIEESVITVEDLEDYLRKFNEKQICKGDSNTCKIFISTYAKQCRACSNRKHKLKVKEENKKMCTKTKRVKIKPEFCKPKRKEQLESIISNVKKEPIE